MTTALAHSVERNRIKGLSEIRRIPRIGKIRLGIRLKTPRGVEFPKDLDYFRFDDDDIKRYPAIRELYGEKPKELDIMLPVEDPRMFFPQAYKLYGSGVLRCKGDGEKATRMLCRKCSQMSCRCNEEREMVEVECPCERLESKQCRAKGMLMVMLYRVAPGGVWQIDTGSFHGIVDVNSGVDYVMALCGRLTMVPLKLRRVPRATNYRGKPSTTHPLKIVCDLPWEMILKIQESKRPAQYLIEAPRDVGDELPALPAPAGEEPEELDQDPEQCMEDVNEEDGTGGEAAHEPSDTAQSDAAKPAQQPPAVPSDAPATLPIDQYTTSLIIEAGRLAGLVGKPAWLKRLEVFGVDGISKLTLDQGEELLRGLTIKARMVIEKALDGISRDETGRARFEGACAAQKVPLESWQTAEPVVLFRVLAQILGTTGLKPIQPA